MVRLVLFLLTSSGIFAEYTVDVMTVGKRTIQDKKEKLVTTTTESRESDNIVAIHGNFVNTNDKFGYNVHFILNKRFKDKDYKDILYLGDNCYLSLPIKKFELVLGRMLYPKSPLTQTGWKDGMEGVGVKSKLSDNFYFYVYLVDFYRGYPLFEKYFLFKNISEESEKGERFRHGLSFIYNEGNLFSKLHFTYLNLGNWGNGTKDDFRSQKRGDSDFIYTGIWNISNKQKFFTIGLELQIVRGLDKTQSNTARKEKSIPISGELLQIYFESYWKMFQTRIQLFLPDSDKRNAQGEVLESGYIGFGSYPGDGFLLNQEINFYPSGWVTADGLRKVNAIQEGRKNAMWTEVSFTMRLTNVFLILKGDYILPRTATGSSTGSISVEKADYEKSFLFELTGSLLYDRRMEEGFFVRCNVSKLYTSKDILLDGTALYLQGGVIF